MRILSANVMNMAAVMYGMYNGFRLSCLHGMR